MNIIHHNPFTISDEMRQVLENQTQILAALAHLTDDGQSPPCTIPLYLEYCVSQTRAILEKDDAEKAEIKRREDESIKARFDELTERLDKLREEIKERGKPGISLQTAPPRYPVTICGIPYNEVKN